MRVLPHSFLIVLSPPRPLPQGRTGGHLVTLSGLTVGVTVALLVRRNAVPGPVHLGEMLAFR